MAMLKGQDGLTPRDDAKKRASEVLKRVDLLLRQGDLENALLESRRVKEIDPRNVYALAFEERILNLLDQREKEAARKTQESEAEAQRRKEEEERQRLENERKAAELREIARHEAARRLAAQQAAAAAAKPPAASPPPPSPPKPPPAQRSLLESLRQQMEGFSSYRAALVEVWEDGAASPEEQQWLAVLRETLAISEVDHTRLEHEVQLECYLKALKQAWAHGRIKADDPSVLTVMRQTFRISPEDHDRIEARLLAEIQSSEKQLDRIVIIDDDVKLLELISDLLKDAGFATLPFTTTDEAYAYLRGGQVPDLILCDVNLETSSMGGFSFYEKIQWLEHLREVPFIFLTGLTDEVLVRTGKELGVDDYLTKPIAEQTLIATIKGKLKRFKRLKQRT